MKRYLIITAVILSIFGLAGLAVDVVDARMGPDRSMTAGMIGPVEIPITGTTSGKPGHEKTLASRHLPKGEYDVSVVASGQQATHPESDIVVRSGGSMVTVRNVSHDSFTESTAEETLTVSRLVIIKVKLGPDGRFSGGVSVIFTPVPGQVGGAVVGETGTVPFTGDTGSLPKAGATGILTGGVAGVSILAFAVHRWLISRNQFSKPILAKQRLYDLVALLKIPLTKVTNQLQSLLDARNNIR